MVPHRIFDALCMGVYGTGIRYVTGSDTSADSGEEEEGERVDNFVYILDSRGKRVREYVCQFCSVFRARKR
jgi:hypothetical protein